MAIPSCHCDHERSVVGGNLIHSPSSGGIKTPLMGEVGWGAIVAVELALPINVFYFFKQYRIIKICFCCISILPILLEVVFIGKPALSPFRYILRLKRLFTQCLKILFSHIVNYGVIGAHYPGLIFTH